MGVPALFRWLSRRYPKIISEVVQEDPVIVDGIEQPVDYTKPNPNGELDNLYLDMNGIVHPCTHPEGRAPPETEDDMMLEVFKYTDRVVTMARPRKVLMIAVDGVAPRAKMNQQRSRRFRAAQDARIEKAEKERAIEEAEARGETIDDAIKGKKAWDTNSITPGTPFMDILATSLRYWVAYKLNNDPGWKDLKVIISDASVPGEGEHKIMEFIRSQRADPAHDPNTSHCIYGLDADLIFLGLATHEPHFKILREDVFAQDNKKKKKHNFSQLDKEQAEAQDALDKKNDLKKPFIWLHVDILREYLELDLHVPRLPFPADFERAIDDWVFMCFFIGNDFLPHMPSLDVRDNSIDTLLAIWKRCLPMMRGYMTCDGEVNLSKVEIFVNQLGKQEDMIFRKKRDQEVRRLENDKRRKFEREQKKQQNNFNDNQMLPPTSKNRTGDRAPINPLEDMPLFTASGESVGNTHMSNSDIVKNRNNITMANMANKSAAQSLKAQLLNGDKPTENTTPDDSDSVVDTETEDAESAHAGEKRKAEEELPKDSKKPAEAGGADDFDEPEDNIRLWEPGYRDRYYRQKFGVDENDTEFRRQVVQHYIEGVCWVLLYYYQGCPSWNWYYPYHYAPFAQDLTDLSDIKIEFNEGIPFRPYEQLMSVLPADSDHTLPEVFRPLMSDPNSEIIDFYPVEFPIDMNGKKMSWQGIALLPFIDETRLLTAVRKKYPLLTEAETYRNSRKEDILLISSRSALYSKIFQNLYEDGNNEQVKFNSVQGVGLGGTVQKEEGIIPGAKLTFPLNEGEMPSFEKDESLTVKYFMPTLTHYNKSMLLNGIRLKEPVLTAEDKDTLLHGGRRNNFNNKKEDAKISAAEYAKRSYKQVFRQGGYKKFIEDIDLANQQQQYYNNHGIYGYNQQQQHYQQYGGGGYRGGRGGYNNNNRNNGNSMDYYNQMYGGYNSNYNNNSYGPPQQNYGGPRGGGRGGYNPGFHGGHRGGGGFNSYPPQQQGYNGGGYLPRPNQQYHNEFQRRGGRGGGHRGRGGGYRGNNNYY